MPITPPPHPLHRRSFLHTTSKFAAAAAVLPASLLTQKTAGQEKREEGDDISANEGLMREHGILKRVLVMYEEVIRRIDAKEDLPMQTIDAALIVRNYIEDYHQKVEEDHIFPLFRKYYGRQDVLRLYAQKLVDLVDILNDQHRVGRGLTDRILSTLRSLKTAEDRQKLAQDMRGFIRMYTPHEAREDTVLFPALHVVISRQEYNALGDKFEETISSE